MFTKTGREFVYTVCVNEMAREEKKKVQVKRQ